MPKRNTLRGSADGFTSGLPRERDLFDQISREDGGQTWPATAFVEWLADEWRANAEQQQPPIGVDQAA